MITPKKRLERMRASFDMNKSVLIEDYRHFTMPVMPHVPTPQSKVARKSEE